MNISDRIENELPDLLKKEISNIDIKDTPSFPLALNVPMPEDHELDNADLSFRFHGFSCTNRGKISLSRVETDGKIGFRVCLDHIRVNGQYTVDAKYAPVINLDTGGTLMPYDSEFNRPRPAGAEEGTGYFDQARKDEFLYQARENRERLMDTENGRAMMSVYNEHKDTYTEIFETSNNVRKTWQQGNTTAEMASHTSEAIKKANETKMSINPPPEEKKFGEGFYKMGYNNNAFVQQVTIASACIAKAKQVVGRAVGDEAPDNKYSRAAMAVLDFKQAIGDQTGNTQEKTKPMTGTNVFDTVRSAKDSMPKMTLHQLNNIHSQAGGKGVDEARENGLYILTESERRLMNIIMVRCYADFCELDDIVPVQLWQGVCEADILGAEISIIPAGEAFHVTVDLPVFDFEINDSQWQGKTAEIVRERFHHMYFIRSLMHERISGSIKSAVINAMNRIRD